MYDAPRRAAPTWAPARSRPPSRRPPTTCSLNYYPAQATALEPALDNRWTRSAPATRAARASASAPKPPATTWQQRRRRLGDSSTPLQQAAPSRRTGSPRHRPPTCSAPGSARSEPVRPARAASPVRTPLESSAWAATTRRSPGLGSVGSTVRTPAQTATALFHNASNAAMALGDSMIRYLAHPPSGDPRDGAHLRPDAQRRWRTRSSAPGSRSATSGSGGPSRRSPACRRRQPGTTPQPGWAPLVPNPQRTPTTSAGTGLRRHRRPR